MTSSFLETKRVSFCPLTPEIAHTYVQKDILFGHMGHDFIFPGGEKSIYLLPCVDAVRQQVQQVRALSHSCAVRIWSCHQCSLVPHRVRLPVEKWGARKNVCVHPINSRLLCGILGGSLCGCSSPTAGARPHRVATTLVRPKGHATLFVGVIYEPWNIASVVGTRTAGLEAP